MRDPNAVLGHNAPVSEFIAWLREWAIDCKAGPRMVAKIDQLRGVDEADAEIEQLTCEIAELQDRVKELEAYEGASDALPSL